MIERMVAKLLGFKIVWIQHHDGEVFKKWVRYSPFGYYGFSHSWVFKIGGFICNEDGSCSGASYVTSWKEN